MRAISDTNAVGRELRKALLQGRAVFFEISRPQFAAHDAQPQQRHALASFQMRVRVVHLEIMKQPPDRMAVAPGHHAPAL
jgi:hypothetical protein